MSIENKYLEMVGPYLDGELAAEDLQSFEREVQSNEELNHLVNKQKEILDGIREFRKQEIIAHLNTLPTPSGGLSSGSLVKIISATLIIGAVGFGIYQMLPDETVIEPAEVVENEVDKTPEQLVEEKPSTALSDPIKEEVEPVQTREPSNASEEKESVTAKEESTEVVVPTIPDPEIDMEDQGEDDLEMPESSIGVAEVSETATMEVDIINDSKYTFHYQVVEDNLVLYGNFSDEPYQIIEINVRDEKQWYLYFKSNYYTIDKQNADITPLERLSNASLIEALDKRKNQDS